MFIGILLSGNLSGLRVTMNRFLFPWHNVAFPFADRGTAKKDCTYRAGLGIYWGRQKVSDTHIPEHQRPLLRDSPIRHSHPRETSSYDLLRLLVGPLEQLLFMWPPCSSYSASPHPRIVRPHNRFGV